jgi:hypothetical protein
MGAKPTFADRLAEIALEYEARMTTGEWVKSRLRWENWKVLREEAVKLAKVEIRRRRWRGAKRGVLPRGISPEDVAGDAIAELLEGNGRLVPGFVVAKVRAELKRLVRQRVRSLHRLREAWAMRGEWDVVAAEDGQPLSAFERMPGEDSGGVEEGAKAFWREAMGGLLENYPELTGVLECVRAGVRNPAQIGQRLGMSENEARNARRRLSKQLVELSKKVGAA